MRRPRALAICVLVALATGTVAEAAVFKGRTSQGRKAKVETDDRSFPTFIGLRWDGRCSDGGVVRVETGFKPPFDERTRTFVRDTGSHPAIMYKGGATYDVRVRAHVRARRAGPSARRWRGTFGGTAVVRYEGRFVARCKSGTVSWRASR